MYDAEGERAQGVCNDRPGTGDSQATVQSGERLSEQDVGALTGVTLNTEGSPSEHVIQSRSSRLFVTEL